MARKASSWASRRVELRASALTCLAKAWRSSSWGEECRRSWACLTGLGVEGELDRGGQGAGSHGARVPHRGYSHHASNLRLTPASHSTLAFQIPIVCYTCVCHTVCPLMHWPSMSQQSLNQHLSYCPQMPVNHDDALDICLGPNIPSCGDLLHPIIHKPSHLLICRLALLL